MRKKRELIHFEQISGIETLGKIRYLESQPPIPPHTHKNCFELTYHVAGEQIYWLNQQKYTISGGDIFLTFPNEEHSSGSTMEDKSYFYYLIFSLDSEFLNWRMESVLSLHKNLLHWPHRKVKADKSFHSILDKIIALHNDKNPIAYEESCALFTAFFVRLLQCGERPSPSKYKDMEELSLEIRNNPFEKYSISKLSAKVNLSNSRFQQKFKEYAGISPMEFVIRAKLETAKTLLFINPSITQTALELGFSSSQHFAESFRRYNGCSPSDFLKKYRQKN